MRDYIRLTSILVLVCLIAAVLLGFTNSFTSTKIQDQIAKANDTARKEVLVDATDFNKIEYSNPNLDIVQEVYEGKANGAVIGYAIKVSPKGYAGPIEIIVGVDTDGVIKGVSIGNNTETPGLGKNAATPKFKDQYQGKTWNADIAVIKNGVPKDNEIVAIAGATITSRAVTVGVNQAMAAAKELANK